MLSAHPILAVFASGQGTNFQSLVESSRQGELGGEIRVLMCDREDAPAIERAKRLGVEVVTPPVGKYRTRIEDERPWIDALRERDVEVIALAGFMRRLHAPILDAFPGRVINIHPSLLPAFPGLDAISQAWEAGVKVTGCTVHLVDGELDAGPILAQSVVPVLESDTRESLETRIHAAEHALYPSTIRRFLREPWTVEGRRVRWDESAPREAPVFRAAPAPGGAPRRGARPPLEAVVFDAGGTLVRLDFEWMCETVTALGFPLEIATLRRAEVDGRRRYDRSLGEPIPPFEKAPPLGSRGDPRAYLGGMLRKSRVPDAIVERAHQAYEVRNLETGLWTRPAEGAREAIDALAAAGLRLAVVSNSDGRAEQHLIDCGVRDGLEFVIDSQIVGVEKPSPRIFEIALERLGVRPERALYVGDILSIDFAGARAAGMHFTLIDPYGDYAPAGVSTIASIDELPQHVRLRFELVASRSREAAVTRDRDVP